MTSRGKYYHYSLAPWDDKRWPNFGPDENGMACKCCGELFYDEMYFDALQHMRDIVGVAININSGHRCPKHNADVSGEKQKTTSEHLRIALDLSISRFTKPPHHLLAAALTAGFRSLGLYKTFIHVDMRPGRFWTSGQQAEEQWAKVVNLDFVQRIIRGHKTTKRSINYEKRSSTTDQSL